MWRKTQNDATPPNHPTDHTAQLHAVLKRNAHCRGAPAQPLYLVRPSVRLSDWAPHTNDELRGNIANYTPLHRQLYDKPLNGAHLKSPRSWASPPRHSDHPPPREQSAWRKTQNDARPHRPQQSYTLCSKAMHAAGDPGAAPLSISNFRRWIFGHLLGPETL